MYRFGMTSLLGFKKTGNTLHIDPVIPPTWDGFEITYQFGATSYQIKVNNPTHIARNVQLVKLDGKILDQKAIPLVNDGQEHTVEVMMGDQGESRTTLKEIQPNSIN
jgi:cellobiose phosphorylase